MSGRALAAGFEHGGKIGDVSVYGQESNPTTWRLAAMNMANPPAFVSDKALAVGTSATKPAASALPLTGDPRWEHGDPPRKSTQCNASFGWLQHMLYHRGIYPKAVYTKQDTHHSRNARPNSDATPSVASMSSNTRGEGEICETIVSPFPVRKRGPIVSGRALAAGESPDDSTTGYCDIPGFCKSATLDEIEEPGFVLTPGRYVGAEEVEDDGIPFADKMAMLAGELADQFAESARLEKNIRTNMKALGFELPKASVK